MSVTRERRIPGRLVKVATVSLGLTIMLSACTTSGSAFPDAAAQRAYLQGLTDERFELLVAQIGQAPDVMGSAYVHAVSGDFASHQNDSVVLFGDPTSSFSQDKASADGDTVDVYHQAGTDFDLLLLGGELTDLAPTEWVAVQTRYEAAEAAAGSLGPACVFPGVSIACGIFTAVSTTSTAGEGALSAAMVSTRNDGSSQITTSASLDSVLAIGTLFVLPDEVVAGLTDQDRRTLLPVTIFQDPDGGLVKIELSGTVASKIPLQLQAGFEVSGPSTIEDLPTPPSGFDVTVIPESDQAAFWEQIEELRQ